jgi:pyridoxine/pyridoxamine 5'-phosphate oxidase
VSDFKNKIKHLREDFNKHKLNFNNLPEHPVSLFSKWMEQALEKNDEANAFVLSTVSDKNTPSSRVLLLRDFDTKGFTFFTNYKSIKANDIGNNMVNMESKFKGKKVEKPLNWGGYKVMPKSVEFWQGRPSRLHDRVKYTISKNNWKLDRLAP